MKGIKVIDVGSNPKDDVTFGTCEICLSYGNEADNPYMVLEFPDGTAEKEQITTSAVNDWILDNQYDFIKAWIDGYEIEKEEDTDE